ncbi:hypothetical protein [Streptomyces sp. JJ36]|uniref:hypothetical protein n=1 Tax=Streptomyces sp. JJ36 TaxID=2736645 RepID=UPI001F417F68|nr:hypothetical protein [Streptomyces sp. JJ36]MCF6522289.1 hypothetical protein [Streptomyces sp. JJ36]
MRVGLAGLRHRHHGDALNAVGVLLFGASAVVPPNPASTTVLAAAVTLMAVSSAMQTRHLRGPLCERCVGAMPLNAAEAAQRKRRWRWTLAAFHATYDRPSRASLAGTTALLLQGAGAALLLGFAEAGDHSRGLGGLVLSLGLLLSLATTWMGRTHSRLQPWCPFCDHGGGGGEGGDRDPAPQDDPGRPVPA